MKLEFPGVAEDMNDAFNSAIEAGVMQREDHRDQKTFFAKFELIASDTEDDEVVADWFLNVFTNEYIRVPRKDNST